MKTFIYPYKKGSKSAKALAKGLGCKRIKTKNSKFRGTRNKTVVNWGSSTLDVNLGNAIIINRPDAVRKAANKLLTMQHLDDNNVAMPDYTTNKEEALHWLERGSKVFCRTKLTGHSGEGIVIAEDIGDLVDAPLYTRWMRIKDEYRVHVFEGEVLDVQRKARKREVPDEDVNWKVRNLEGGFIFARADIAPPQDVLEQSIKAVEALGLDFGAVDVITSKYNPDVCAVLEVNTACGLMGTTLEKYIQKFGEL